MGKAHLIATFSGMALLQVGCEESPVDMGPPAPKDPIHVRTMTALTGATSENGGPYYQGIKDAIREANDTGGIMGHMVEERTVDHSYMKDKWVAAYETWKSNDPDFDKVIQFFSWGTPDTQEFIKEAQARKVPWISGSYATTLATPVPQRRTIHVPAEAAPREFVAEGAPYNFFAGTDYSTQIRIAMDFVKKRGGSKIAFVYCTGSSFCKEPIPPGKTFADSIGLTIGPDLNFELGDSEATVDAKVQAYVQSNPGTEWFWVGNSILTATYFAKAIKKYQPTDTPRLITNLYGMDERTFALCGEACVGNVYSVQGFAAFGDPRYTGMADLMAVYGKWRTRDGEAEDKWRNMRYVQGYVSFHLFRRGIELLIAGNKSLTGQNLKEAYETFRGLQIGGLAPPITFTAEDHRPTNITRIYSVNAFGNMKFEDEMTIELRSEWLGW